MWSGVLKRAHSRVGIGEDGGPSEFVRGRGGRKSKKEK